MTSSRKKRKKMVVSAIISALSVVLLYCGALLDMIGPSIVALASFLIVLVQVELGGAYPWMVYIVTSLLSLVLLPNKSPAFIYLCIGGIYPILKIFFERIPGILRWIVKSLYFAIVLTSYILISIFIFLLPKSQWGYFVPLCILGAFVFFLYDILLSRILILYIVKFRNRLGLRKFLDD